MTEEELTELVLNARSITNEFLTNIHALKKTKYKNLRFGDMIAYEDYQDKDLRFVYFMGAYKQLNNETMEESYEVICYDKERPLCSCLNECYYPNIHKIDSFSKKYNGQCIVYQDNPGIVIESALGNEYPVGYRLLLGDEKSGSSILTYFRNTRCDIITSWNIY